MIIKLIIDLATKEVNCDDSLVVVNNITIVDNVISLEVSKPDIESLPPGMQWQQ
jgi:hypothetical protein